ncbi:guanylate kinase [Suttonella ornithocola]|uniref:Guanylate kinase n=1 Tax=Suttonella ornithocola TaxID=279832 RepID=A0A380MRA2_9GAMM|nr:guanylate kinase [Suttonella ornithocola]SUO95140.1 Guanylate kinase [Suttonella ornithocola]
MKGQLWIVAAPSGGGKTSLIAAAKNALSNVVESVSHTTRERRNGEIDGTHYHFVTKEAFSALREAGDFLEHADVFHHAYATSGKQVDALLSAGNDVILSIDWQGAEQVRVKRPDVKTVFLLPPSLAALRERLMRRGQDDAAVVNSRMAEAKEQISHYKDFDYIIINDDFNRAASELQSLIIAARLERQRLQEDLSNHVSKLNNDE